MGNGGELLSLSAVVTDLCVRVVLQTREAIFLQHKYRVFVSSRMSLFTRTLRPHQPRSNQLNSSTLNNKRRFELWFETVTTINCGLYGQLLLDKIKDIFGFLKISKD